MADVARKVFALLSSKGQKITVILNSLRLYKNAMTFVSGKSVNVPLHNPLLPMQTKWRWTTSDFLEIQPCDEIPCRRK